MRQIRLDDLRHDEGLLVDVLFETNKITFDIVYAYIIDEEDHADFEMTFEGERLDYSFRYLGETDRCDISLLSEEEYLGKITHIDVRPDGVSFATINGQWIVKKFSNYFTTFGHLHGPNDHYLIR